MVEQLVDNKVTPYHYGSESYSRGDFSFFKFYLPIIDGKPAEEAKGLAKLVVDHVSDVLSELMPGGLLSKLGFGISETRPEPFDSYFCYLLQRSISTTVPYNLATLNNKGSVRISVCYDKKDGVAQNSALSVSHHDHDERRRAELVRVMEALNPSKILKTTP